MTETKTIYWTICQRPVVSGNSKSICISILKGWVNNHSCGWETYWKASKDLCTNALLRYHD